MAANDSGRLAVVYAKQARTLVLQFKFDTQKKVQAAGILLKLECGRMDRIRLLKLLYIADREALAEQGSPIIGGRVAALDNGPLHCEVYDLIKGEHLAEAEWSAHFKNEGHAICMLNEPGRKKLSRYEIAKLTEISERFRSADTWDVVNQTHEFEEWKTSHVQGTSRQIPLEAMLKALQFTEEDIKIVQDGADERARVKAAFSTR
jgi:uncharacterized phage-associated protein